MDQSRINNIQLRMMAAEAAARHRIPVAEYDHPKGVIVPGDQLLTDNIRNDRDYVPYCGPCTPMQRMRRFKEGFRCPTCGQTTNWDLTPFNGNVDVQFDLEHMDDMAREWVAKQDRIKAMLVAIKELQEPAKHSWLEDTGKKNTSVHKCGKCAMDFFGKRSRKYCKPCQENVAQYVNERIQQNYITSPFYEGNRKDRRHGY